MYKVKFKKHLKENYAYFKVVSNFIRADNNLEEVLVEYFKNLYKKHRENDLPTRIWLSGNKEWWKDNKFQYGFNEYKQKYYWDEETNRMITENK